MSIVSLQFLVFLAILTAIYFLVPKKGQWVVLLSGSVFFYIVVGGLIGLAFVFVTSFTIWLSAKKVEKLEGRAKKALAHLTVAFNLGLLIVLKYGMFLLKELGELLGVFGVVLVPVEFTPLLPLGISFYTLQAIG